jgi:hypothetical protein
MSGHGQGCPCFACDPINATLYPVHSKPSAFSECPCFCCQEHPIETCSGACEGAAPQLGDYDCEHCPTQKHCEVWLDGKKDTE